MTTEGKRPSETIRNLAHARACRRSGAVAVRHYAECIYDVIDYLDAEHARRQAWEASVDERLDAFEDAWSRRHEP